MAPITAPPTAKERSPIPRTTMMTRSTASTLKPPFLNAYMYVFNVPRHVHVCNLAGPVGEAACQRKSSGARLERLSDVPEGTERHYCEGCDHVLERATASEQGDSC